MRFLALINAILDAMRAESTFVSASFNVDPDEPNHFLLHETWMDHNDVVETQMKRAYRDRFHAALPEILERERQIAMWTSLRAD